MLGGEQSGHIEAIGFEMYTTMLEEAVRKMKGEEQTKPARRRHRPSTSASRSASTPTISRRRTSGCASTRRSRALERSPNSLRFGRSYKIATAHRRSRCSTCSRLRRFACSASSLALHRSTASAHRLSCPIPTATRRSRSKRSWRWYTSSSPRPVNADPSHIAPGIAPAPDRTVDPTQADEASSAAMPKSGAQFTPQGLACAGPLPSAGRRPRIVPPPKPAPCSTP